MRKSIPSNYRSSWKLKQQFHPDGKQKSIPKPDITKLEAELKVKKPSDWYSISISQISSRGGNPLLTQYNGSIYSLVSHFYPTYDWKPWLFNKTPKHFFESKENQRKYMNWLGSELGYQNIDDWQKITKNDLLENGGSALLKLYDGSTRALFQSIFTEPEYQTFYSKIGGISPNQWESPTFQRKFFDDFSVLFGIKELSDWYQVKEEEFMQKIRGNAGHGLMKKYGNSLPKALMNIYPDYNWLVWKFERVPSGYWKEKENQKKYLEWIANELGYLNSESKEIDFEKFYNIKQSDIMSKGGSGLLQYYEGSAIKALKSIFPERNWEVWKFARVPSHSWDDKEKINKFLEQMSEVLQIKSLDDWYRVSKDQISDLGGSSLISQHGGLFNILSSKYPTHKWIPSKFTSRAKKASQRWLKVCLEELLPNREMREDYIHPDIKFESSGEQIEIDIYVPSLNLAFEYQGQQHYKDVYIFGSTDQYKSRDEEKRVGCKNKGITLIEIPYWWDRSTSSLFNSVILARPDLASIISWKPESSEPIPQSMPSVDSSLNPWMIAEEWNSQIDPQGWWLSENHLGIRVFWNGRKLFSKQQNEIKIPYSMISELPKDLSLDAIIKSSSLSTQELSGKLSIKGDIDKEILSSLELHILDVPSIKLPFELRMEKLHEIFNKKLQSVEVTEAVKCTDWGYFHEFLKNYSDGVILRKSNSMYNPGRSDSFLVAKDLMETTVKLVGINNEAGGLICSHNGVNSTVKCSKQTLELLTRELNNIKEVKVKHFGFWKGGKLKEPFFSSIPAAQ